MKKLKELLHVVKNKMYICKVNLDNALSVCGEGGAESRCISCDNVRERLLETRKGYGSKFSRIK